MDHLERIINSLDQAEKKEFQHFIQRNKKRNGRKDLALFKLYCRDELPGVDEQIGLLEIPNKNAYYSTRKRLYAHLSDYALLKTNEEDGSAGSRVRGLYNIALHLFDRGLDRLAWNILLKGALLGQKNRLYAELNAIYLLQVDKLHLQENLILFNVVRAYESNRELLLQSEKVALFQAELRQNMMQVSRSGMDIDLKQVLQRIIAQNSLGKDVTQDPRLLCTVMHTIRDSAIYSKQYASFEHLVESLYRGLYDKTQPEFNVELLYMIAHAKYRNKGFTESRAHIELLEEQLALCSKTKQKQMSLRVRMLDAANDLFLVGVDSAIGKLESLLTFSLSGRQECNAILNLSTYYFYKGDYRSAHQRMLELRHTDSWYEEQMGAEWLLKQKMIELLIFHELEEVDLTESRLRAIKRKYKDLLSLPRYQNAEIFLELVKRYSQRLHEIEPSALDDMVNISWDWLPKEQEDLQAMMFYAWIKSKIVGGSSYDVLIQLMTGVSQPEAVA